MPANIVDEVITPVLEKVMCGEKNMLKEVELSVAARRPNNTVTYAMVAFAVSLICVLCVGLIVMMFRLQQKKKKEFDYWILDSALISHDGLKHSMSGSMHSLYGGDTISGIYDGMSVLLRNLATSPPKKWSGATKRHVVNILKNVSKGNILGIVGISSRNRDVYFVFANPGKGALHHTLKKARFDLDLNLKLSLAMDLIDAVSYLHSKSIVHGFLNCQNCFLDGGWSVKLGGWADCSVYLKEEPDQIQYMYQLEEPIDACQRAKVFYADPRSFRGEIDRNSDIFSVGLLLFEIFTIKASETVSDSEMARILKKKVGMKEVLLHRKANEVPDNIMSIIRACIGSIGGRPSPSFIHNFFKSLVGKKRGIVDMLMEGMEQYMNHLEEKIQERTSKLQEQTSALEEITTKMETLLFEILPPPIARQLINGETVQPEFFECVTIFFSDVVGFTDLCSKLTPSQVMTFLNDLWMMFDTVTSKYDVYKIDTIEIEESHSTSRAIFNAITQESTETVTTLEARIEAKVQAAFPNTTPKGIEIEKIAQLIEAINIAEVKRAMIAVQQKTFKDAISDAQRLENH